MKYQNYLTTDSDKTIRLIRLLVGVVFGHTISADGIIKNKYRTDWKMS